MKNLNVAVREWQDEVIFLHKIIEGAADKSYGIHVARLAGVPRNVVERSKEILSQLEEEHLDAEGRAKNRSPTSGREEDKHSAHVIRPCGSSAGGRIAGTWISIPRHRSPRYRFCSDGKKTWRKRRSGDRLGNHVGRRNRPRR